LAAVFAAAPIFLLIIRQLGAGPRATALILAVVLINTNLGGMATPIGDFPAIILMASGVISFKSYLFLAFPLALFTALVVTAIAAIVIPSMWAESDDDIRAIGRFAVEGLSQRMQFARPDWWIIGLLSLDFLAMIFTWAIANPAAWPFHYTAIAGTVIACIIVGGKSTSDVLATYDLKTTIFMAITLAIAAIASATGVLHALAGFLSAHIANPVLLLFVVMFCTTVAAAIFQAGPAAAAMLPIVAVLAEGGLKAYGDWVYVAFAGAICAGSSMFVWSATSGPALVGEAEKADIAWGIMKYLPYGLAAALLQFLIVALWVAYAVVPGLEFWYAATGFVFMIGGGVGLVVGPILTRHGRRNGRTEGDRDLHALGISIVRLSIVVELLGIMTKVVTWMW
jgi:Na+/H+ antiporter NhaD/arsenite permease-like protein